MDTAEAPESRANRPVTLHHHAMDNLSFIRETMERSVAFTTISGRGTLAVGLIGLAGTYVAALRLHPGWWISVWVVTACLAATTGFLTLANKAHRGKSSMFAGPGRRFVRSLLPPFVAGAILTAVLYRSGLEHLMPGTWLLLYGAGVVTGGAFSLRIVPIMGLCFMGLGVAAFFAPIPNTVVLFGPITVLDGLLALGFGLFHVVFGAVIAKKYGG